MNNVQCAGMRLYGDAGKECRAWDSFEAFISLVMDGEKTYKIIPLLVLIWIQYGKNCDIIFIASIQKSHPFNSPFSSI